MANFDTSSNIHLNFKLDGADFEEKVKPVKSNLMGWMPKQGGEAANSNYLTEFGEDRHGNMGIEKYNLNWKYGNQGQTWEYGNQEI